MCVQLFRYFGKLFINDSLFYQARSPAYADRSEGRIGSVMNYQVTQPRLIDLRARPIVTNIQTHTFVDLLSDFCHQGEPVASVSLGRATWN